jgi:DNA-binding NarL/FixJ family response regulator
VALRWSARNVPRHATAPSSPSSAADQAALTRRDREIADLVAQRLSNRDIAAKLGSSNALPAGRSSTS